MNKKNREVVPIGSPESDLEYVPGLDGRPTDVIRWKRGTYRLTKQGWLAVGLVLFIASAGIFVALQNSWFRLVVLGDNLWQGPRTFERYHGGSSIEIGRAEGDVRLVGIKRNISMFRVELYQLDNLNEVEETHLFTRKGEWLGSWITEHRLRNDVTYFYHFTPQGQRIMSASYYKYGDERIEVLPGITQQYREKVKRILRQNGWWVFF